jgi:hypothetical protein
MSSPTSNNVTISRTVTKVAGHPPVVNLQQSLQGSDLTDFELSRVLTSTNSEAAEGVLTQKRVPWSCGFFREESFASVTLPPLTDSMTNSEWFAALDDRIAAVNLAFDALLPGEHKETITKEYSV